MTFRQNYPSSIVCLLTGVVVYFGSINFVNAEADYPPHFSHHDLGHEARTPIFIETLWDSKYVSEGRDNLGEGGLASVAAEWTTPSGDNELVLGAWYTEGIDVNYSELNLGASYILPMESIDVTFGYTWLDFAKDGESDNELSIEFATGIIDSIDLLAAFVYSTEAEGSYIELVASKEFERNQFTSMPYILLGINEGYVAGELKGLNQLQFGVEASKPLNDKLELNGYLAYTIALKERPGDTLDDIFWAGFGFGFGN